MSNILLLTPQLPYPPHQGTSLRNFHIIKGLAGRHKITLLSFLQEVDEKYPVKSTPLSELCEHVVTVPGPAQRSTRKRLRQMIFTRLPDMAMRLDSRRFEVTLKRMLGEQQYDFVQVEGIELAWTIEIIQQVRPSQKIIYDAHNAEALLQYRALQADVRTPKRWPAAAYSWVQQKRLKKFEGQIGQKVDWITAVSQTDKNTLEDQFDEKKAPVTVIPNCIDITEYDNEMSDFPSGETPNYDIIFMGKMDYRPNVDAVLWFADQVWPKILNERAETTWVIVGQKPHKRLDRLKNVQGVSLTGWVERVQPYLRNSAVFIMPFRVGSGTRLKLIEAMAAGKAVVSTPVGIEGYPVESGKELLIADSAGEMAQQILEMLGDEAFRSKLAENGKILAKKYDWRHVIPLFDQVYEGLS